MTPIEVARLPEPEAPQPVRYIDAAKRQLPLIILVTLVAIGIAFALTRMQDNVYRAQMTLVFGSLEGRFNPDIELTQTMTALLESDGVARAVIDKLNLDTTTEKLSEKFNVIQRSDSSVVDATFDSTKPVQARRILEAYASEFNRLVVDELQIAGDEIPAANAAGTQEVFAKVFSAPVVDAKPVGPNRVRTIAIAGVLGLLVGFMLAVLRERLDNTIRNRRDAEESFGAPVVAMMPRGLQHKPHAVLTGDKQDAWVDEALYRLSLSVDSTGNGRGPTTICVTSPGREPEKSHFVANFAVALARSGARVVCVEGDSRERGVLRALGITQAAPGVAEAAVGAVDVPSALVPVALGDLAANGRRADQLLQVDGTETEAPSTGSLAVVPAGGTKGGTPPTNHELEALVAQLRLLADVVIIDGPPVVEGRAFPFLREANSVLLVASRGRTSRSAAESARAVLRLLNAASVGVVLTHADTRELAS